MKTIMMKRAGEPPERVDLPEEVSIWDFMKQETGNAMLQRINLPTTGGCLELWMDEEGKFKNLPRNFIFPREVGTMFGDFCVGTVFITQFDGENGCSTGLTDEELQDAEEFFETCG